MESGVTYNASGVIVGIEEISPAEVRLLLRQARKEAGNDQAKLAELQKWREELDNDRKASKARIQDLRMTVQKLAREKTGAEKTPNRLRGNGDIGGKRSD